MPLIFCPHCRSRITAPEKASGRVADCPGCGKGFKLPSFAALLPALDNPVATLVQEARPIPWAEPITPIDLPAPPRAILVKFPDYPPAPPAHVVNVYMTNKQAPAERTRWSPAVAMLLSLLFPGGGQIYKGQPVNGLAWLVLTVAAYIAFPPAGLVLHVCCVLGSGMGDTRR